MSLSYKVLLRPEPEGGYTVNIPALPGCITYGETLEEAKSNTKEAIELYIESVQWCRILKKIYPSAQPKRYLSKPV